MHINKVKSGQIYLYCNYSLHFYFQPIRMQYFIHPQFTLDIDEPVLHMCKDVLS